MAQVNFVKPAGRDLSGPTSNVSRTIQAMPWTGELVVGITGGDGTLKVGPNDPSIAGIVNIGKDAGSGVRWFQLNAKRAGNVMVEARGADNAVLDFFQLAIKDVRPLPAASTPMEFEFEADDPAKPGQINLKVYSPTNEPDWLENRLESIGYGIYLSGCLLFCTGLELPVYLPDSDIDFNAINAVAVNTTIYPTRSDADMAIQQAPASAGGGRLFAYYRGAGGALIAPTVFTPSNTPRTIQTLRTARSLLAESVQNELSVMALGMVGGWILKGLLSLRVRVGSKKAEPPAGAPPPLRLHPALERLRKTMMNRQNRMVTRTAEVLTKPRVFRHSITSNVPSTSYAGIQRDGSLRISTGDAAHFGEGVYAWHPGSKGAATYIDVEVPPGVAVETLDFGGGKGWVRLVPAQGDRVPVKIIGTNLTPEQIAFGKQLLGP
jgi:hypothetical protein